MAEALALADADKCDQLLTLLDAQPALRDARDAKGNTLLILACKRTQGGRRLALQFLKRGVDVNEPNSNGVTALMWAASHQNSPCVELLLERGARTDIKALSGPWSTDEGYGFIRDGATREHSRGQLSRQNALRYFKVVDQVMTQVSIGPLSIGALCMCSRSAAAAGCAVRCCAAVRAEDVLIRGSL